MGKKKPNKLRASQVVKARFVPGSNGTAWIQKDGKKEADRKACRKGQYD